MRDRLVFPVVAAFLLLALVGSSYAHHGITSWFDTARSITVKGAVTSFEWTNPHSYVYFDVKDAKGATEKWTAEMGGVGMLSRIGWRRDTLKPGSEITATGNPAKDGKPMMLLGKIVLPGGQELLGRDAAPSGEGTEAPKQ